VLCSIAQVSRCGYYKHVKLPNKDNSDYLLIKEIFERAKCKLGWRPIKMRLEANYGIIMNHKKIKRIMRENNLQTKIRRVNPYKMIMKKTQEHRTFENILARKFKQDIPRQVLGTDITYLYHASGRKAYLSIIKDIATKEIVSWQVSNNLTMKFVLDSLEELKNKQIISKQTIIHSDQGFHYTNPEFIKKVKSLQLVQSMSRKGNCIDNAPTESFFGHFKDDVDYKHCKNLNELNNLISNYMNYYNNHRQQWAIKKMTPVQYKHHLLSQLN